MIYQLHETHGKHIAYNTVEADANIGNGWKTVTEEEFNCGGLKEKKVEAEKPIRDLAYRYETKFGKKPHHKMKDSTIQAKLDE